MNNETVTTNLVIDE